MREYTPEELKKLQKYELSILKDVIKVCEENELSYFGLAGTGIGALRHGGFIPWDDDIDIGLLRNDYEKLMEIVKRDYAGKYTVVNADEFRGYPLMTTRITLNGTVFIEESLKNINSPLGIFLDVYALDNIPYDVKKAKRQAIGAWVYSKLLILKHIPFPVLPVKGVLGKTIHAITAMVFAFLNVFFISHNFLYKRCKKISCKYNKTACNAYGYFCDTSYSTNTFTHEQLFPLRKIKFEDIEMCFPNKLEESLEKMFGDYMQLPPPEKRKNHYPHKLVFPEKEHATK